MTEAIHNKRRGRETKRPTERLTDSERERETSKGRQRRDAVGGTGSGTHHEVDPGIDKVNGARKQRRYFKLAGPQRAPSRSDDGAHGRVDQGLHHAILVAQLTPGYERDGTKAGAYNRTRARGEGVGGHHDEEHLQERHPKEGIALEFQIRTKRIVDPFAYISIYASCTYLVPPSYPKYSR